jgi:hypothetical protein
MSSLGGTKKDDDLSATVGTLQESRSAMSPRAALGRSIKITAEAVLEAIGNSTYGGEGSDYDDYDGDYEGGVYHRPMEVLEAVAETPRPMTARQRGSSLAPNKRLAEVGNSFVDRWDISSPAALEFLRTELKIDQLLKSKRMDEAKLGAPAAVVPSSTSYLGIAPAAVLPPASLHEIATLRGKCAALQTATGIVDDASGSFDEDVLALHKRIQLLDPLYAEEMSNRVDVTLSALKKRAASKAALLELVGDTNADQQKMHQLKELTKVVADTHASIHAALRVVGRMQAMRGLHQEAYFRATSLAEITEEMRLCDALLASAPEELEDMKPMLADIGPAVRESLASFKERLRDIIPLSA